MNAVIKVEATRTRLFLVVVVIGVAFLAASLLEQLLRRGELPREDWPRWYSRFNHPMLYRSTADAPYSYVVLPQRMFPDWLSKPRRRSATKLLSKDEAHQIAATIPKLPELFAGGLVVFVPTRGREKRRRVVINLVKPRFAYIILTALVSSQQGSRHVPTRFTETFPQFGNCRSLDGDSRFSCDRADWT